MESVELNSTKQKENSVIYSLNLAFSRSLLNDNVADGSNKFMRLMINISAERRSVKAEPWLPSAVVFDLPSLNAHVHQSVFLM